ncbi:MAG: hypothetical protein ACK5L6_08745 [Anaerorhabdus sp.]
MAQYIELVNNQYKIINATNKKGRINIEEFKTVFTLIDYTSLDPIKNELREKKNNKSTIVVNNSGPFYREVKVPFVDDKNTMQILNNELRASQTINQEFVLDKIELGKVPEENLRRILACGLPLNQIEAYMKLLKDIKCKKPRMIDLGYNALFNYIDKTNINNSDAPYVILEVSNNLLKVFLFDEKKFVLQRSERISFDDYEYVVAKIKEEISLMQQFQLSRRYQVKIESIYLFGESNGLDTLVNELRNSYPMAVELLPQLSNVTAPEEFNYLAYVYILGSMVSNPKTMNFATNYDKYAKDQKAMDSGKRKLLILIGISIVLMGGAFGGLFYLNYELENNIRTEEAYVSQPDLIEKAAKVSEEDALLVAYNTISSEMEAVKNNLKYYPDMNAYLVQVIYGYEDAKITQMSTTAGILNINLLTSNVDISTYYPDYLRNSGLFKSVDYFGVQKTKEGYEFNVIAELKRGE